MRWRRIAWCCGIATPIAAWLWFEATSSPRPWPDDTAPVPVAVAAPRDADTLREAAPDVASPVRAAPVARGEIRPAQPGSNAEPYVDPDAPPTWSPGRPAVHVGAYVDPDGPQLTPEEGRTVHVGEWLDPEDQRDNDGL
ncbi:MAG: hypothetical protein OXH15_22915 [Gammaproteobacteria bacterium]|nr:hypothetical protein [Gammaproteobacteria bacterium]